MHFDTVNHLVGVFSDEVDSKGRPVRQWELNIETGHITETKRTGDEVTITHKDVDPTELNKEQNEKMIDQDTQETAAWIDALSEKKEEKELAGAEIIDEWNDLEKQRDIAFKIMYFFIVFIIFTFTLLYVFFRMTQQQQEEEARRKGVKAREGAHQETFLDFLAGQTDNEHYVVNPYARHSATKITSQFTSASTPFANLAAQSYEKAQQLARKGQNNSEQPTGSAGHRDNRGFGANNLVHLANEERGRFDDVNFNNDTKLANFSAMQNL